MNAGIARIAKSATIDRPIASGCSFRGSSCSGGGGSISSRCIGDRSAKGDARIAAQIAARIAGGGLRRNFEGDDHFELE
eukprot:11145410-Alexandrium_andersonii.AAC.1